MAKFKVGQRVRFVGSDGINHPALGAEGVIVREAVKHGWDWVVNFPAARATPVGCLSANEYFADSENLAPLTGPNEEWASDQVRKLFKMPVAA